MMSVRRWPADRSRVAASIPVQSLPQLRLVLLDAPGAWLTRCASASLKRPSFVMNGEEMGQSDLSRRIAWRLRISGFDDPEPVFVASPAASTKADIGPPAVISNVGSPRWPGRGRTGSVSWRRDGTPQSPFSGEGPARRRWRHIARNALSAIGCPTFKSVGS